MNRGSGVDLRGFGLNDNDLMALGYRVRNGGESPGPARPPPGRRRIDGALGTWAATLSLLLVMSWASSPARGLPDPVPAAAPDTTFSSSRAMAQLVEIAARPHAPGSPEHDRVRNHLVARLRSHGLEPEIQVATSVAVDSGHVRAATVRNVVASIPGSRSTGAVAIITHYDSAPLSPGATDSGVAVAAILEVVRAITASEPLRNDVLVVLTDAGELGSLGARAFGATEGIARDLAVVIEVDTRGSRGRSFTLASGRDHGPLVDAFGAVGLSLAPTALAAEMLGPTEASERAPPLTTGARVVRIVSAGGAAKRHQPGDLPSEVDERTLQDVGRQLLLSTRTFAQTDHASSASRASSGPTYVTFPALGPVSYSSRYSPLIGLGLLAVWLLTALVVRARRGTRRGVLVGVGLGIFVVGATATLSGALLDFLSELHPEYGMLDTAFYRDRAHLLAVLALAMALMSSGYAVARRWFRTDEIVFGALAVPLGLCLWVTFRHPVAAAAVQWPMATTLLGGGLLSLLGPRRAGSSAAWVAFMLLTSATLILIVPSLETAAMAWTFRGATVLGAVFGVAALTTLPLMDWLVRPRAWLTPSLALMAGGSLVALATPWGPGTVEHPTPTTLVYFTAEAARSLVPSTPDSDAQRDSTAVRRVLGQWLTVPGPGERWARSWVGESATGSRDAGVLFLPSQRRYEAAGTGPESEIAPPRARLLGAHLKEGRLSVRVGISSGLLGEVLALQVPAGRTTDLTSVGDVQWGDAAVPVRSLEHWGRPESMELLVSAWLEPGADFLELVVLEHHLRPREVLGDIFFERPDSLVANARAGSDRIIQKTLVRVAVPGGEEVWADRNVVRVSRPLGTS